MASLFNQQPVIGAVKITDGRKLYNGLPVVGVRVGSGSVVKNQMVRGIAVLADGSRLHNGGVVIGVYVVTDPNQNIFNNAPVMPVSVVSGSLA